MSNRKNPARRGASAGLVKLDCWAAFDDRDHTDFALNQQAIWLGRRFGWSPSRARVAAELVFGRR